MIRCVLCLLLCLAPLFRPISWSDFPRGTTWALERPMRHGDTATCPDPATKDPEILYAVSFSSLEKYEDYFSTAPADFITYAMLERFGEFVSYYNLSGPEGIGSSAYCFTDGGQTVTLSVHQLPVAYIWSQTADLLPVTPTGDWLLSSRESDGIYQMGNITYMYNRHELCKIFWVGNGCVYELQLDHEVRVQPPEKLCNAFLSRLCHVGTAQEALREFNADIATALGLQEEASAMQMPFDLVDTEAKPYPAMTYPLNFCTLSKYEQYFAQAPSDFVTYDMVRELGGFLGYSCMTYCNLDGGCYHFCNEDGVPTATLYFYKNSGERRLGRFLNNDDRYGLVYSVERGGMLLPYGGNVATAGQILCRTRTLQQTYPDVLWSNGACDFMLRFEENAQRDGVSLDPVLSFFTKPETVLAAVQMLQPSLAAVEKGLQPNEVGTRADLTEADFAGCSTREEVIASAGLCHRRSFHYDGSVTELYRIHNENGFGSFISVKYRTDGTRIFEE